MPEDKDYVDLLEQVVMNRLGSGRAAAAPKKGAAQKGFDPAARAEEIFFGAASGGDPIAAAAAEVRGAGGAGGGGGGGAGGAGQPRTITDGQGPPRTGGGGLLDKNSRLMRNQKKGFDAIQWLIPPVRSIRKGADMVMDAPKYLKEAADYWAEDPYARRGQ